MTNIRKIEVSRLKRVGFPQHVDIYYPKFCYGVMLVSVILCCVIGFGGILTVSLRHHSEECPIIKCNQTNSQCEDIDCTNDVCQTITDWCICYTYAISDNLDISREECDITTNCANVKNVKCYWDDNDISGTLALNENYYKNIMFGLSIAIIIPGVCLMLSIIFLCVNMKNLETKELPPNFQSWQTLN
jgi:hypothetical protein